MSFSCSWLLYLPEGLQVYILRPKPYSYISLYTCTDSIRCLSRTPTITTIPPGVFTAGSYYG